LEQLPNHFEFEALQAYDSWYENDYNNLNEIEDYWVQCVELVILLKEGVAINSAQVPREGNNNDVTMFCK